MSSFDKVKHFNKKNIEFIKLSSNQVMSVVANENGLVENRILDSINNYSENTMSDFSEDGQTDGSLNQARVEALQPFKDISAKRLAQYDFDAPLPNPSDTNNPDFAALFPGAKNFKQ